MEYYTSTKRNGSLVYTTSWMDLKALMLSEKSQSQKGYKLCDSMRWNAQNGNIIEMENMLLVPRRKGSEGGYVMDKEVRQWDLCADAMFLYLDCSSGYMNLHIQ